METKVSKNNTKQELEAVKVVRLLQKELRWQLDYSRGGIFKNNQTSGLFFFLCPYHDSFTEASSELRDYTMFYYPVKEKQFGCGCGAEFKNVYEIWAKEKKINLNKAIKEVDSLFKNSNFEDDYEQLPQYRPSYGGSYKISRKLIKKNTYNNNE